MENQERRRNPRVAVDLRVRYRRADGSTAFGTLADLSVGGLRLIGGEALPAGTRLAIGFEDPAGHRHEVVGDVVRSEPRGGFAVSFVELDAATRRFIEDALAATR